MSCRVTRRNRRKIPEKNPDNVEALFYSELHMDHGVLNWSGDKFLVSTFESELQQQSVTMILLGLRYCNAPIYGRVFKECVEYTHA